MSSGESNERLVNACPACGQRVEVSQLDPFTKVACPHCGGSMRVRATFDHFQLLEQIGIGGMSRVFRAFDTLLKRDVALKILNQECSNDAGRIQQFEREAQITASISHPNVVRVFSVGRDQGYFYIAMELVDYSSFEDVITRRGRVTEREVLNIGIAVSQGLRAAHGTGLIHRDIKPGNVLFAADGTAKIVDFGLALVFEREVDDSGEIWATPYYVAPEKLSGRAEDLRSDIYSLGATLFHALAGRPPIEAHTTSIEELRAVKARAIDLGKAAPAVSAATVEVVHRMLAYDPADRFSTYEELTEALQAAKLGRRPGSRDSGGLRGLHRRKSLIAWGAAIVVAGGVAIAWWQRSQDSGSSSPGLAGLVLDETPSGGGAAATDFLQARRQMLAGDHAGAAALFEEVAQRETTRQPTLNWALLNAGLCHLLRFDETSALAAFEAIVARGVYSRNQEDLELVSFFLDLAKRVQSRDPLRPGQMQVFAKAGYPAVGFLAMGLRRWGQGDSDGGAELLRTFDELSGSSDSAWLRAYRILVAPFLEDASALASLPGEPAADSEDELLRLEEFLVAGERVLQALQLEGSVRDRLAGRLQDARQRFGLLAFGGEGEDAGGAGETAAEDVRTLERDRAALRQVLQSLRPAAQAFRFPACLEQLQAVSLESPTVRLERDAWCHIFKDAGSFVNQIGGMQAGTLAGPVIRSAAPPIPCERFSLATAGISIRSGEGAAADSDAIIPYSDCAPAFLIGIAEKDLRQTADSDHYMEKLARLLSFARTQGLQDTVVPHFELLADAVEAETFGAARLKVLAAGTAY